MIVKVIMSLEVGLENDQYFKVIVGRWQDQISSIDLYNVVFCERIKCLWNVVDLFFAPFNSYNQKVPILSSNWACGLVV